eukprot:c27900_g1_i1 orf=315-3470(+)
MGRRQPLLLASTSQALNSVLRPHHVHGLPSNGCFREKQPAQTFSGQSISSKLKAGFLLWPEENLGFQMDSQGVRLVQFWEKHAGMASCLDLATVVGLSAAALRRLCLPSGSWVFVKHSQTNVGRPAKVVVLDPPAFHPIAAMPPEDVDIVSCILNDLAKSRFPFYALSSYGNTVLDPEAAYLSPLLAFNIGLHLAWIQQWLSYRYDGSGTSSPNRSDSFFYSTVEICPLNNIIRVLAEPTGRNSIEVSSSSKGIQEGIGLKYASHARISFVRTPISSFLQFEDDNVPSTMEGRLDWIDTALRNYFACDRVLARGDIFAVSIGSEGVLGTDEGFGTALGSSTIYFKVIAMEPSADAFLIVNRSHTALVLGGSVSSQLPPAFLMYHQEKRVTPLQSRSVCQLARLLGPFLHHWAPSLKLRTAVLMHGPAGCGKRTVVRQVANELGMHVVEYNCHELVGASEEKTSIALKQTFEVARRYAPSVLLLRRFGALGKVSLGGPSTSDGGMARVATVLRESIFGSLNSNNDDDVRTFMLEGKANQKLFTVQYLRQKAGLVLVVAASESTETLTPQLYRCFTHEISVEAPDESQRLKLVQHFLNINKKCGKFSTGLDSKEKDDLEEMLKTIASQTSGLVLRDLRAIAADAGASMISRTLDEENYDGEALSPCKLLHEEDCKPKCKENKLYPDKNMKSLLLGDKRNQEDNSGNQIKSSSNSSQISLADLENAFGHIKLRTASAIGTPKVPNVKWEDVGGLEDVKKAILDTVQLPLLHRDLFTSGLRQRSGVLLYGPPGTGKTLLAKAVATECSLNFLSVKGPELINMYIGESEKNVREIFQKARAACPCVIFFDELDALAPARGASGDSGGVMDRVVSQMLAEIDGLNDNSKDLFIIGASNRPDLIDPALLRPGRFDKLLFVGISTDFLYRQRVLEALTRKFSLDEHVSLEDLAQKCPMNFTGADMYALCADAWLRAVKFKVCTIDQEVKNHARADADLGDVLVRQEDFMEALCHLTPSLSLVELERYEHLRAQFEGKPISSSSSSGQSTSYVSSMYDLD